MNNVYKGKAKYILAPVVTLLLIAGSLTGNGHGSFLKRLPYIADTIIPVASSVPNDTIPDASIDSIPFKKNLRDTSVKIKTDTLNVKMSKDSLDAPIVYHADDSVVLDAPSKKIILYGKESKTTYKDNELTAPGMEFDQSTNLVTASIKKDSAGRVIGFPIYKQKDFKSISDTIRFNMKTGKGLTKGTYTQQGEMYVYGTAIKKVSPDIFFAYHGRFTTCNLDTPHFAFVSKKIEFINKKMAITGPVHPEFEGVPLPIYLPFGIFPLQQGRHSGIIAPVFTANQQLGIALENLGYYKVLSDDWDVTVLATLYSYGSYNFSIAPRYIKRYHYNGNFLFDYRYTKLNFQGDPDYSVSKDFSLVWNDRMDSKARPGVSFGASVNVASQNYNATTPNEPVLNFNNQLSSSITFSKVWQDKPFNLSLNAGHTQNSNTGQYSVTLPDVAFNVNTLYPFRRKEAAGTLKWFENIGIALNSDARSATTFATDSITTKELSVSKQISQNYQWGAQHNVPISLSLPPVGPLHITPSVSYQERWFQEKLFQTWDGAKLDSTIQKGFYASRAMSFGLNLSTRIFGMFNFGKKSKIQAIRHEIDPSISLSYVPNMNSQFYYNLQYDSAGDVRRANVFEANNLYGGAFSETKFAGLTFGIGNNIQMKVRNPKDTSSANAVKKVVLLDQLSIGGDYNFLLDSFALSTLAINASSNLFNKVRITAGGTLDPYQVDSVGDRINTLVWKQKLLTLGRLTSATISLSSQFKGGSNKKVTPGQSPASAINQQTGLPMDEYQTEMAYITNNPNEFTDFSIPWSVNLSYSLEYSRFRNPDTKIPGLVSSVEQSVTWSGTLGLSDKWQLALNSTYNFSNGQLGYLSLSLNRDMHCWQMAISIAPVGTYHFFSITLNPKSPLLRDLRLNRARSYSTSNSF